MNKKLMFLIFLFISCSSGDESTEIINDNNEAESNQEEAFKKIVDDNYNNDSFSFGSLLILS